MYIKSFPPRVLGSLLLTVILGPAIAAPTLAQEADNAPAAEVAPKRNLLIDAERLLRSQRHDTAYRLLAHFRETRGGEPNFDFLLGRAALNTGRVAEAVTLFEGILSRVPGNVLVRIWLAQAYLASGERDRAYAEYQRLDSLYLPESLSQFVKAQLNSMEQGAVPEPVALMKPMWSGYLETAGGYDTNISSATDAERIYIPALGNLPMTLSDQVRRQEDAYYTLGAGSHVVVPLTSGVAAYARGDIRYQNNNKEKDYNSSQGNLGGGVVFLSGKHMARVGINGSLVEYRGVADHKILGADLEYTYTMSRKDQLTGFLSHARYRFEHDFELNDMNRIVGGIGYKHAFDFHNSSLSVSIFSGREDDVAPRTPSNPNGGSIDGGQDFHGLALSGRIVPRKDIELFAGASWQHGSYERRNVIFLQTRKDERLGATLGAVVDLGSDWSLRPLFVFSKNNTNIPVNSHERKVFSVSLRKDFR